MKALRAFLMLRHAASDWEVGVYRDLESIEDAWANEKGGVTGVLHVGFWRPNEASLDQIANSHPGRLLLSDSACSALPPGHTSISAVIGVVEGLQFRVATTGWGYSLSDDEVVGSGLDEHADVPIDQSHPFAEEYSSKGDWVQSFTQVAPNLGSTALALGVVGEPSYLAREDVLPDLIREAMGWERYVFYAGLLPDVDSLLQNLRFAPPWLLDTKIGNLSLSTRSINALNSRGVSSLRQLIPLGRSGLRAIENVGHKSALEIAEEILLTFAKGPWRRCSEESEKIAQARRDLISTRRPGPPTRVRLPSFEKRQSAQEVERTDFGSAVDLLRSSVSRLKEMHHQVLHLRMGFGGERLTLEDTGRRLGVTRERIRQIEKKAATRLSVLPHWRDEMIPRIEKCLTGRTSPLPLHGLEVLDPWFAGVESLRLPFGYALKNFCGAQYSILTIDDQPYISAVSPLEWEVAISKAREVVDSFAGKGVSEIAVRAAVEGLLGSKGNDLRSILWEKTTGRAHFANDENGRLLVSVGAGVEHAVEAILSESEIPLHYSRIAELCRLRLQREIDVRRAHNAASNVGLLYGRGVYGLRKHLPLADNECRLVVTESENLLIDVGTSRQWHATEILQKLRDAGLNFDGRLNAYVLSILLAQSTKLVNLKRLVWASKETGAQGASDRIDVNQAIKAVLLSAGRPMSSNEIREKLSQERGLSTYFQIHVDEEIVRVAPGLWGLASRDLPLNASEIEDVTIALRLALETNGKGIHVSEILDVLKEWSVLADDSGVEPTLLMDLASRDSQLKIGRGQFLYLEEWGGPRRLTVAQAAREALRLSPNDGLTTEEAERYVISLLERPASRQTIVACLGDIGAQYSEATLRWRISDGPVHEESAQESFEWS